MTDTPKTEARRVPPTLRLDRSRPYSECHGERTGDDPHKDVHYFQDSLPFDASYVLVPDDGKTEGWLTKHVDGTGVVQTIARQPLYNAEMRRTLARRIARLERQGTVVNDAAEVDFLAYLTGESKYGQQALFDAAATRFHRKFSRLTDLVDYLIYEEQVCTEQQAAADVLRLLDPAPAAA